MPSDRSPVDVALYLVSPPRLAAGPLVGLVPELAAAGVGMVQLRAKDLEARELCLVGEAVAGACRDAGVPFIVNDRADVAVAVGASGVHVGQSDLPVPAARRVAPGAIVGLSTHSARDLDAVRTPPGGPDYCACGPVYATPTKPGRAATGTELLSYAAERAPVPWFAIGGIDENNLDEVLAAGARRIVVVRAITEAADPVAAAANLRRRLDAAGSAP